MARKCQPEDVKSPVLPRTAPESTVLCSTSYCGVARDQAAQERQAINYQWVILTRPMDLFRLMPALKSK